jgi:hypothetical protein
MKHLSAKTLGGLLRTYDVAIGELRAMRDREVENLIERLQRHRDEVAAALAAMERRTAA